MGSCAEASCSIGMFLCSFLVMALQEIKSEWLTRADPSSNTRDVARERVGPKLWNTHDIAYLHESDKAVFSDVIKKNPHFESMFSYATFCKYKPFWLRPHDWLTCKCPKCYELEGFLKAYNRKILDWHKELDAKNKELDGEALSQPAEELDLSVEQDMCLQCKEHNPLYGCPNSLTALYKLCVCAHAVSFGPETVQACAQGLPYVSLRVSL